MVFYYVAYWLEEIVSSYPSKPNMTVYTYGVAWAGVFQITEIRMSCKTLLVSMCVRINI